MGIHPDQEILDTLKSIEVQKLTKEDKIDLLNLFNNTKSYVVQDQIALIFGEANFDFAVPYIFEKIRDKTNYNHTGTLVYALDYFDMKPYLKELIEIIFEQGYESKIMAYNLIKEFSLSLSEDEKQPNLNHLIERRDKLKNDIDTLDIVDETMSLLI